LIEHAISIEDISPLELYGVNNSRLRQIKEAFPELVFLARGNELRIRGNEVHLTEAKKVIGSILAELLRRGGVTDERFDELLDKNEETKAETENPNGTDVILHGSRGNLIRPKTKGQRDIVEAASSHDIVIAVGPAGTGKTYTAVALAVKALKEKRVQKIFLVRPAVEAGENLGFLPGDLKDKIDPYLRPLYDALEEMLHFDKLKSYLEKNTIEIAPLAYMRGRTLNNAFVILDEAQNATEMQLKMFLTRMGRDSKIIVTGDDSQIDLPRNQRSGLLQGIRILAAIEGIAIIRLSYRDVVRHALVKKILSAYDNENKKQK